MNLGKNVYVGTLNLGGKAKKINIYKKLSNLAKPFWGLTKNRLDDLKVLGMPYCVELVCHYGSIFLNAEQVEELIKGKKTNENGAYLINWEDLQDMHMTF